VLVKTDVWRRNTEVEEGWKEIDIVQGRWRNRVLGMAELAGNGTAKAL
jgi:hypothetical protein